MYPSEEGTKPYDVVSGEPQSFRNIFHSLFPSSFFFTFVSISRRETPMIDILLGEWTLFKY